MVEDAPFEESLTSKLLRWLVTSVILGKLFGKLDIPGSKLSKSSYETLNYLFQDFANKCVENNKVDLIVKRYQLPQSFTSNSFLVCVAEGSLLLYLLFSDVSEYTGSAFKLGRRTSLASLGQEYTAL